MATFSDLIRCHREIMFALWHVADGKAVMAATIGEIDWRREELLVKEELNALEVLEALGDRTHEFEPVNCSTFPLPQPYLQCKHCGLIIMQDDLQPGTFCKTTAKALFWPNLPSLTPR